ncbi:hypothetical protein GCM10027563_08940 [Parasphingorhabdus pacifica]
MVLCAKYTGGEYVKAAAERALDADTDEALTRFLEHDWEVAQARDVEKATVTELVERAEEAGRQAREHTVAAQQATERALNAAEQAKIAAERARAETEAAQGDVVRASAAAAEAADTAERAAAAARTAINAASAADEAARVAANAYSAASAAAMDASQAQAARNKLLQMAGNSFDVTSAAGAPARAKITMLAGAISVSLGMWRSMTTIRGRTRGCSPCRTAFSRSRQPFWRLTCACRKG